MARRKSLNDIYAQKARIFDNIRSGASGTQALNRFLRTKNAGARYEANIMKAIGFKGIRGLTLADPNKKVSRNVYMGINAG